MKKSVFGLVKSEQEADRIVASLQQAGFSAADISVIFFFIFGHVQSTGVTGTNFTNVQNDVRTSNTPHGTIAHEKHTKAPEGGVTGGVTGGIIGGTLGLLAGIGAIAIPGLGAFIAAGPIMAALGGSAVGGSLGLLVGALIGMGIPEYEAKKYTDSLKAGNVLLSVHAETSDQVSRAKDILQKEGAYDISTSGVATGSPH